jgi:hypothetical protein
MQARSARRSAFLGLGVMLLAVAPVLADTVRADADLVTVGSQAQLDLGTVAPGTVLERDVTFTLLCGGLKHADPGQVVTVSVSSVTVPLAGGSISATNGSIGPVPDTWVSDEGGSISCPEGSALSLDSSTPSHVTLVAPPTAGLDYQFTILFAKSLSPAGFSDSTSVTGSTSVTFIVDVATPDTTPPVLSGMPSDLDVWTDDPAGVVVDYPMPSATDDTDPAPSVDCDPAPVSFFVLGTTTVTCTASDVSGNSASATFEVTVNLTPDTTPPVLAGVPNDVDVWTDDPAGLVVDYVMPTATDDRDPAPSVGCAPPSGSLFPVATTTVTCTATDADLNTSSATFDVTVNLTPDTTPPVLSGLPSNIEVETTDSLGLVVDYAMPTATDDRDPAPNVVCDPPSGALFAVGTTTVTCTATDADNNSSSGTFDVAVTLASGEVPDTTPPVIDGMPADIGVLTTNASGMIVSYSAPTATDDRDPSPVVGCAPASGSLFPVGTTTVTCTASDVSGNSSSASFDVTVHLATADWAGSAGADGTSTVKAGHDFRPKAQSLVDGSAVGGTGSFVFTSCGSESVELTVVADWQSGRWTATVDTTGMALGCHTVWLVVDGFTYGSMELLIEANPKPNRPR